MPVMYKCSKYLYSLYQIGYKFPLVPVFTTIFTARKRSLGQGNIFTPVCHSVHRGGSTWAGTPLDQVHPPPGRYTPLDQVHPSPPPPRPGTPPWDQVHPRDQLHAPRPGTPLDPQSSACWEIWATNGQYASYCNAFLCKRKYPQLCYLPIAKILVRRGTRDEPKLHKGGTTECQKLGYQ